MKAQIDVAADGVISIGVFVAADGASLVATERRNGAPVEVLALRGVLPWALLATALEHLQPPAVAIYTCDKAMATALTPPFPPPAPDKVAQVPYWGKVSYGGDAQHWACLRALAMTRFKVFLVDGAQLRRARAIYDASNFDSNNDRSRPVPGGTAGTQAGGDGGTRKSLPVDAYTAEERRFASLMLGGKNRAGVRHPGRRTRRRKAHPVPAGD